MGKKAEIKAITQAIKPTKPTRLAKVTFLLKALLNYGLPISLVQIKPLEQLDGEYIARSQRLELRKQPI